MLWNLNGFLYDKMNIMEETTPGISPEPAEVLVSLEQIVDHLKKKGPKFQDTLLKISLGQKLDDGLKLGWHTFSSDRGYLTKTIANSFGGDALFTGAQLCEFASYALQEALSIVAPSLEFDTVPLETSNEAESWDHSKHKLYTGPHTVVKATDMVTGQIAYFDPTYKQIDSRFEDSVLVFTEEEFPKYFRSARNPQENKFKLRYDQQSNLASKESKIRYLEKTKGITHDHYQQLVQTLI